MSVLMEQTCCVVTVSDSSSSEKQRSPLSCSGVVLNSQSGVVLCSGMLFSLFLMDKDCKNQNLTVLQSNNFSKMQISIELADMTAEQCTNKQNIKNRHPKQHKKAELLMMVNCMEFQRAFQKLFIEAEKWNFYSGDDDAEALFDSFFISWFAVLKISGLATQSDTVPWVKSTVLEKGCSVLACGSPFGSFCPDLFMSSLSKGIVSNLSGEENALILTDARCLPGTEGGGLFISDGDGPFLVGLITSPLCWKSNEWIGLALVCSFHLILKNILQAVTPQQLLREISTYSFIDISQVHSSVNQKIANGMYPRVAMVESGLLWGSGILLNPQLLLTCRHVVNRNKFLQVRVNADERIDAVRGHVLYSSKESSPYDVAVVQLKEPFSDVKNPKFASSFQSGEDVVVLGYGALGKTCGPSVTSGILSRVICQKNKPVMLQTTCAVQCGASGGAVIRASTGELLGIVSSNTRDFGAKVTYPHLNFSIPVTVLDPVLDRFAQTGDVTVFETLDSAEDGVRQVWRLQIPQSKL